MQVENFFYGVRLLRDLFSKISSEKNLRKTFRFFFYHMLIKKKNLV